MAAEYKMERNPRPEADGQPQPLHPRLVSQGTVGTNELAQYAEDTSSVSAADMKGALAVLARFTARQLRDGYTVYIEGIGYLKPTLKSRPVMDAKEIRSESVHFKNVVFRCDIDLKHELKTMPVFKAPVPKVKDYDREERMARLVWYLDKNEYITSSYYRALNHCSKYSAQNDLNRFTEEGLLVRSGVRSSTMYRKNEHAALVTERFIPEE